MPPHQLPSLATNYIATNYYKGITQFANIITLAAAEHFDDSWLTDNKALKTYMHATIMMQTF